MNGYSFVGSSRRRRNFGNLADALEPHQKPFRKDSPLILCMMTDARSLGSLFRAGSRRWAIVVARLCDVRRGLQDTQGAVAVEFAIVSTMLICSILFVMAAGLILYIGQSLDYATSKAARQIMTGYVQKNGIDQTAFRTQILCSYLPKAINCGDVIVNVQTLKEASKPAGYYAFVKNDQSGLLIPSLSNSSAQFDVGIQASYVYLQVIYPVTFLPSFLSNILSGGATYNQAPAYLAVSTAAFRNEQY